MKKIFVCIILCLCLTGCGNNTAEDQDVITYEISEIANITMTIDNVTPTGATILITDNTGEENVYGEWYRIEKFENETWQEVEVVAENPVFTAIGYLLDENNQLELQVNWDWLYGSLNSGRYRLIKEINHKYIAVEFTIEN